MRYRPLSVHGELAIRRLGGLKAFHDRVARYLGHGSIVRTASGSDARTLQETVLVRCVSILEAYVTDLGQEVLERRLADAIGDPRIRDLASYLVTAQWDSARSWRAYEDIWQEGVGVSLADFQQWDKVKVTRAGRNAVVHAFGEYNAEYRRVARTKLERLGIDPDRASGRIPLDGDDIHDGIAVARAFVIWADPLVA